MFSFHSAYNTSVFHTCTLDIINVVTHVRRIKFKGERQLYEIYSFSSAVFPSDIEQASI